MDIYTIIAHAIGYLGTTLAICSFQSNKRTGVLLFQTLANCAFSVHFYMLGAYAGMAMNILSGVRCFTFYFKDRCPILQNKLCMYIFCLAFLLAGIVTWEGPISILVIVAGFITTVSFFMNSAAAVRKLVWANSPCWLVYNYLHGSWAGILTESFALVSIIVAVFRYDIFKKEEKQS